MVSYINQLFPFLENSDFIKTSDETVDISNIYCPINFEDNLSDNNQVLVQRKRFQAVRVYPCNVLLINEPESVVKKIKSGVYGTQISLNTTDYDYASIASQLDITDNKAYLHMNKGYEEQEVASDVFVNAASNGTTVDETFLKSVGVPRSNQIMNLKDWLSGYSEEEIMESADMFDDMLSDAEAGKETTVETEQTKDYVYKWLDSYFALPEGVSATQGGREVVPLLIGPTGVFKSSTVKELCKKYDYRLVDFRVAFTSRLDYSGLFQMGEVDGKKYSYACPMEEIVTCSDGFREYCRRAYDKVSQILQDGYITKGKASDGEKTESLQEPLTDDQRKTLENVLAKYKEYIKVPVLFLDEITRCFSGDTRVRLLDGRIRTMKELYDEYGTEEPFYVYACDSNGHVKFVKAYSRGITRKNAQMIKVTLDNGAEVICTPDHRWMLRDGSYEQAQYFERGRSLMGTYFGTFKHNPGRFSSEYETFIDPATLRELETHQEVTKQYDTSGLYGSQDESGDYYQAHHIDLNSRNNVPENLVVMTRKDHREIHNIGGANYNKYLMESNPEYAEWARLGFKRAMEKCPDFMDRQKKSLIPVRESFEYRSLRSRVGKDTHSSDEYRDSQRKRCLDQWDRGDFDFDRKESLRKNHIERCIRFVKLLMDAGYEVNEDNYDNFVDRFTGSHGPYYTVMHTEALKRNGLVFEDILEGVLIRDWKSELLHEMDEYNSRLSKIRYSEDIQDEMDNGDKVSRIKRDYSDVNMKSAHVQKTLSFLNEIGDVSEDEYCKIYSERDKRKWQNVYKLNRIKMEFGSFARAKEISRIYNHKVVKVEWLDTPMDAYDIEVPGLSNFLIDLGDDSGVFVHNCKDIGVEGLLTEMLNQKRFNNMQLQGCKFVAATNLNLKSRTNMRHNDKMDELDEMYDVNQDIDVAYSNRFLPLRVQPEDVQDRWFVWASKEKTTPTGTRQNIHPLIIEYLNTPQGKQMVYNDTPVLDALDQGLTENETKSQSYPNYRTWEMLSDYLYKVDRDYELDKKEDPNNAVKVYRRNIINGLISSWGADRFIPFLEQKGYKDIDSVIGEVDDEFTDFLENSLDAGVPALMIGPSSMGKTTRVKSYVRKERERTGLEPVLINIDLSSKDVVDLMGMPSKISILDYVAGDMSSIPDVGKELSDIVESVTKEEKYGLSDILTVRAPDKSVKDLLVKAKEEGREVIFMFDECNRVKNTSVLSAMFEVISDARMSGVDFSDMKDKVKVVAACNMAHSEMDDAGDYSSAGAIDPALAARFTVFWKKKYDEKDVRSWIAYMEHEKEEGHIDGTVLEYFKNLEPERAIEIIASVEKRQLAYAEPSTRNLHQLSMDIKSMRGQSESEDSKLFYGKLLFDDMTRGEFGDIYDAISSSTNDDVDVANKIVKLIAELQDQRDVWDSQIANRKVTLNSRELTAGDLMDNLKKCEEEIRKLIMTPLDSNGQKRLKALNRLAVDLLRACNDLDDMTSQSREAIFETYVGEEFAREFTPYFNENFGSGTDTEITIEMLSDKSLVKPFFKKYRSAHSGMMEEKYEDSMLDLMREYMKVHGKSLQPDVYAAFVDGIGNSLASSDGMERILKKTDNSVDDLFVEAEKVGDAWILGLLAATRITQSDIDVVRSKLSGKTQNTGRKRKSVVL